MDDPQIIAAKEAERKKRWLSGKLEYAGVRKSSGFSNVENVVIYHCIPYIFLSTFRGN